MDVLAALKVNAPPYGNSTFSPHASTWPNGARLAEVFSLPIRTDQLTTLITRDCSAACTENRSPVPSTSRRIVNSVQLAITPEVGAPRTGAGSKSSQRIECSDW